MERYTYYATIIYPESAQKDWIEILKSLHIPALISPLHDKDVDKDGNLKKRHYHVIFLFESLKSEKQAQTIADKIGGVKVIPIHCLGSYARYLCHLDDTDKAQYSTKDVIEISGANYSECCRVANEKKEEKILIDITNMILDNEVEYFHEVTDKILQEHEDWFGALVKNSYYIRAVVMSIATKKINEKKGLI